MEENKQAASQKIQIYPTSTGEISPFWRDKYEKDAKKYWDIFYKRHQDKFFKDRHYLDKEWGQYFSGTDEKVILEVGCGAGNTIFPLLATIPNIFVYACDFSPRAVNLVKKKLSCIARDFPKMGGLTGCCWKLGGGCLGVANGLKVNRSQFLFHFADEFQAAEVLQRGRRWMGDTFLKLEGWEELSGCEDPHFTRDIVVVNLWCWRWHWRLEMGEVMESLHREGRRGGRRGGENGLEQVSGKFTMPVTYGTRVALHKDLTVWNPIIERVEKRRASWEK
ncbi:hypothetical protein MTR67_035681 [Solanum verrucosum]|uniref:Uncharacterized protein n=1 Tax=Solanum verrucosum TaxID=315347 RepID=A0AAF0UB32_SOLVR|nr:hypothetical protein MTR67_035681 [Solanum verrucosum]